MQKYFVLLVMLISHDAFALELFGVAIENIDRVQLRQAIQNSGAEIVREAGDDNWYDIYNVSENFSQAKRLFVAYDKTSAKFAFAEYHFAYDFLKTMRLKLINKYGNPRVLYGLFESDKSYIWKVDGIDIKLTLDWQKNISRLVYSQAGNTNLLVQAYRQAQQTKLSTALQKGSAYY
ncbi:MAG: hypothetical protein KAU21_11420 [Gammaproteobacteria bacterium]|nr:hypothetical protein [Gammaproteobacteria bacterium]